MPTLSVVNENCAGGSQPPVLRVSLEGMSYGTAQVLGAVELAIAAGETVALTGQSGVGKSSLLRVIAGLERGYIGRVDAPERLSVVFQEPTLLPWRSAAQNLMITTGVGRSAAEAALADVGLAGLGDRYPAALSLGQQRRLSLARAFAASPDLLLMDEPFVSLDPELADEMMHLFARLRGERNVATLLVTHVEAEAQKLADRIVALGGSPATIVSDRQNNGAYRQLSASGVTTSKS